MTISRSNNCKLWDECLNYISRRIKSSSYNTWFRHTRGEMEGSSGLLIDVPNQFVCDWLTDRYRDLITEAIREVHGRILDYRFSISEAREAIPQTEIVFRAPLKTEKRPGNGNGFNERNRFDSFVVGKFNQFAHAAALAVAEAPGKTNYNPLFIYGGTGLGKTHLVQAIGHYIYENFPGRRVMYATSEKFTSDFITSISNGTIANFTLQYRTADVLLIDDIQFFSGKESTQEQFFHTFNDLHQAGRQIVLTSDRPPRETKGLEERLLSRFSSGLVADLQPPDLETRIAILRRRTNRENGKIPDEVLFFIADNVTSNIRELDGSLTKLMAYASLERAEINLDFAVRVLGREIVRRRNEITIPEIQRRTAELFHIDLNLMTAKKKSADVALARQVAMYLARKYTDASLKSIGAAFGGRDHSTVIHGCALVEGKIKSDIDFRDRVRALTEILLHQQ